MGERENPIGIPPSHIYAKWERLITPLAMAEQWGLQYGAQPEWGTPVAASVWCDEDGRPKASALEYANGRRIETRHRKGNYSTTFRRALGNPAAAREGVGR
jgi:hypothetical protein